MRFSPREAYLEEYWGVLALNARVLAPPKGGFELPRTSIVVISKGPGSAGCEVAMPGFGRK